MSASLIIDTSVYVEHFRNGAFKKELANLPYLIRNSSVVLAELYRGCRSEKEKKTIDELADTFPLVTPNENSWKESGKLLHSLYQNKGYSPDKLKELHFDCLIALSARNFGASLLTLNTKDFQEIKKIKDFKLISWKI